MSDPLTDIRKAQRDVEHSQARLQAAVLSARNERVTWAEIGDALNMTRQAAFKRFGKPKDPTTGGTMSKLSAAQVRDITEAFFRSIAAGDEAATMAMLHPDADLSWDEIITVWKHFVAEQGELEGFGETSVVAPGEGASAPTAAASMSDGAMLGLSVGVTTLRQEAGELMGRVAVDADGKVAGVLYLPTDATEFPF